MVAYRLQINGETRSVEALPDTPLLWVIRDCSRSDRHQIRLRHRPMRRLHRIHGRQAAALLLDPDLGDRRREITTIEGLQGREAEAVQKAWIARDVPQCGYCQSGQIMSAVALLSGQQQADRQRHRSGDERQYLPLRHLCPHPRRHPRRCQRSLEG